jgi:hypothetical protein
MDREKGGQGWDQKQTVPLFAPFPLVLKKLFSSKLKLRDRSSFRSRLHFISENTGSYV